jgi:flagellar biogenesis protein FliO
MDLLQGLTIVFVLLVTLVGAVVWLRQKGYAQFSAPGIRNTRRLQVLERQMLTPQHSLHLIAVDGRVLLVASAPGGCTVLTPLDGNGGAK